MSKITDAISSFNSLVTSIVTLIVIGIIGVGGWFAYDKFYAPEIRAREAAAKELEEARGELERVSNQLTETESKVKKQELMIADQATTIGQQNQTITEQGEAIEELEIANEKLETAMRLLKVNHRLARIKVLKVGTNEETGEQYSDVEFVEMTPDGKQLGKPMEFRLNGDEIRIDCWIVKFDDKYIQESDLHRSTSLVVFKSIYGNADGPRSAHPLEERFSRPEAYARGSRLTDFEEKIWNDFWEISNDPTRALQLGIRANHGQVNYVKAQEGLIYQVDLRASDGLTIRPIAIDESLKNNSDASDGTE